MTFVDPASLPLTKRSKASPHEEAPDRERLRTNLRRLGVAVLAVQLAIMIGWNAFEVSRFSETVDFSSFYHVWYLIGHGNLNPVPGWWKAQAIFIMWPLALVAAVFPQPLALLTIQDVATVLAELIAYFWLVDILVSRPKLPLKEWSLLGLGLLVLNPWMYWSISWDYHSEAVGVLFAILASRAFYAGRRSAWVWSALTALSGLVPCTYLLGIALGLLLVKGRRRPALLLGLATLIWLFVMLKLGAGAGLLSGQSTHTAVKASDPVGSTLHEIGQAASRIPTDLPDMLANLAPSGFIGAITSPVIGVVAVVLGTSATAGGFRSVTPSFQDIAIYVYMPVGTIIVLGYLARRYGLRLARGLFALILVFTIGWAVVWIPQMKSHWVTVSAQNAGALRVAQRLIPRNADLVISQGISGVFGNRSSLHVLTDPVPGWVPVDRRDIWFLFTPYSGTETQSVQTTASMIQFLAKDLHARLALGRQDVWLLEWHPRQQPTHVTFPKPANTITAAVFDTQGRRNTAGPLRDWSMSSGGRPGLVVYGDYWLERVGRYKMSAVVRSNGPFQVVLRNATTGAVLDSRTFKSTHGTQQVTLTGAVTPKDPPTSIEPYKGAGPFHVEPVPAPTGNDLELTVGAIGSSRVTVTTLAIQSA